MDDQRIFNRNFKLHWASVAISQIGSFFTMVALPWLVLYRTDNNAIIMTTVLAATSLPHGFFILFGGALADRMSPLKVLFTCRIGFVVVMASLALLVFFTVIPVWAIYTYAFLLGTLGAFVIPSNQALLPTILDPADLGRGNGIIVGTMQLAQMIGPVLAGWLIWFGRKLSGTPDGAADYTSLAIALAADAAAVFIAVIFMCFMQIKSFTPQHLPLLKIIRQGFSFCWYDAGIRLVLMYLMLVSFFLHGPLLALLPLFTKIELGLSEGSYGTLYAMLGSGTLIGAGLVILDRLPVNRLGIVVLLCDLTSGMCFYLLGNSGNAWLAGTLLFVMGICSGIIMVAGTTWFQRRTPEPYMGRVMGILMFAVIGLIPLSATLTGFLINASSISEAIRLAGTMIVLCSSIGLLIPHIRNMGNLPRIKPAVLQQWEAAGK